MDESGSRREWVWRVATVGALVAAVSWLHYGTQTTQPLLHDVYRRLYYLPVGLAAVWFGFRGGVAVSVGVAVVYTPYIAVYWNDMGRELANRSMEVALYFLFAGVIGYFADRDREQRRRLQEANDRLKRSYADLRHQADTLLEVEENLRGVDRLTAIGRLSASVTHEIRNPLGAIKGTVEILRDEFTPDHPKAEFFEILLKETDRLNQVVEEFLQYARPPNDDQQREVVDLYALARETVTFLAPVARKAGVTIALAPGETVEVCGRAAQLKQVLVNLLLNAIQASSAGHGVRIGLGAFSATEDTDEYGDRLEEVARLWVEDEGVGVDDAIADRMFDAFVTTKEEGTGLGLAISRKIAEAHRGTLSAETPEGGGARFTLTLPLVDPERLGPPETAAD